MAQKGIRGAASDPPKSAANFVRRSARAIRSRDASIQYRAAEREALIEWAVQKNLVVTDDFLDRFDYKGSGAEHRVYYDEETNSAIKVTHPNKFGHSSFGPFRSATAVEYFLRLAWCNALLGDDFRMIGMIYDEEQIQLLSSQPWISAHQNPHPEKAEIDSYFQRIRFHPGLANEDAPLYYNADSGLIILDAHDHNVIRDWDGKIAAIDVVIGLPGPEVCLEIQNFTGGPLLPR